MFSVKSDGNSSSSIISEGVKIEGNIHFPYPVEIDGIVIGDIISDDVLIIGREGKVESNIKTKNAVISGIFTGDMVASGTVTITPTGKFIGNLVQKGTMLAIEKGGLFKGKSIVSNGKSHTN
jgi:cytoskeletal protein CcmA (bactofilin family)